MIFVQLIIFRIKLGLFHEHCDSCVVCLTHHIIALISINALHEANLELITTANLLVRISSIMLEWSRRIINMLLYENGEILTLVSMAMLTRVNISPYSYNNLLLFSHFARILYDSRRK